MTTSWQRVAWAETASGQRSRLAWLSPPWSGSTRPHCSAARDCLTTLDEETRVCGSFARARWEDHLMGEILGLGMTHYPPLTGHDRDMANILRTVLRDPGLPERYRDPASWPEPMRREYAEDGGT